MIVTVMFRGIDLNVHGTHFPEDPAVRYDSDMGGHPGYPEYFEITDIFIEKTEAMDLLEEHLDEIEKLVLTELKE